jgi:hypothetical protein
LEAAPEDLPRKMLWATENINTADCQERTVGKGKSNTQAIMIEAAKRGGGFGWAAQACDAFTLNGFDDWFLPSMDELHYMYGNLHMQGLGNLYSDYYWSSTAQDNSSSIWENFADGKRSWTYYAWGDGRGTYRVRPIRQVAGPAGNTRSSVEPGAVPGTPANPGGIAGTPVKSVKKKSNIWYTLLGILVGGALLGYIGYVVITTPEPAPAN